MIRGIHTVNRNLNVLQKKIENTTANIANVKTPGYKFQDVVQSTMESHEMINYQGGSRVNRRSEIGPYVFGNRLDSTYRVFNQGSLENTLDDTDFALVEDGFFTVRLNTGQLGYTRNGHFKLDEDNNLVTMEGYNVLGRTEDGNLENINAIGGNLSLSNDGYINNSDLKLNIVDFNNYNNFETFGDTIFLTNQEGQLVEGSPVRQGSLEMSNINHADEMVKLIEISNEFEANQKLVNTCDETLSKAVNEIGRV